MTALWTNFNKQWEYDWKHLYFEIILDWQEESQQLYRVRLRLHPAMASIITLHNHDIFMKPKQSTMIGCLLTKLHVYFRIHQILH